MLINFSPNNNNDKKKSYLIFNSQTLKKNDFHESSEKNIILKEGSIKKREFFFFLIILIYEKSENHSHIRALQKIYGQPKKTFPFQKDFSLKQKHINDKFSNQKNIVDFFPLIIQKSYTTKKL